MTDTTATQRRLDLRGKTISVYLLYEIHTALAEVAEGERVDVVTDPDPVIDTDLRAWCRSTGNPLVDVVDDGETRRFVVEKGPPKEVAHKLALILTVDGLLELLSPLGFALTAALEGHDVVLYLNGSAVRLLDKGFTARIHGLGRPFSRFARKGLAEAGHLPPGQKLAQLQELGARLYACGPSMDHFKVDPDDLAFPDVTVCSYPTFMEQMDTADMHLFV